jgi:hypothetical protein
VDFNEAPASLDKLKKTRSVEAASKTEKVSISVSPTDSFSAASSLSSTCLSINADNEAFSSSQSSSPKNIKNSAEILSAQLQKDVKTLENSAILMLFAQNKISTPANSASITPISSSELSPMPKTSAMQKANLIATPFINIVEPITLESNKLAKEKNEGTNDTSNEMVQLFHQLENQQLANLILKSKIESLKASLNGTTTATSASDRDHLLDSANNNSLPSSYSPRSMPTTPTTSLLASESMLSSLLNKNASSTNSVPRTDLNGHYLSKDDLALNHISSAHKHAFSHVSINTESLKKFLLENKKETYFDDDEEIMKHTKNEEAASKSLLLDSPLSKNSFSAKKSKSLKTKLESKMFTKKYMSDLNNTTSNGNSHAAQDENGIGGSTVLPPSVAAVSAKTPKSALLEKRRKAVFELLTHEIYPSDEKMNEFLRLNKELFSSKREFLTKLREVRQKIMNNLTSNNNSNNNSTATITDAKCQKEVLNSPIPLPTPQITAATTNTTTTTTSTAATTN